MGKITFILGGARSGKSQLAVKMANGKNAKVAFIATCLPLDKEMKERIEVHKKSRPSHWKTFEAPNDIVFLLKDIDSRFDIIIIDCLTLLISNLLSEGLVDKAIEENVDKILKQLKAVKSRSIIVSNEVGLGIVPDNELGRRFRDLAGRVNQMVAGKADDVFFMASGLPLKMKGVKVE